MHHIVLYNLICILLIGASRSEPHTNHSYEKIAVPMYVCLFVCMYVVAIRRPRVHHALCACARISQFGKNRRSPNGPAGDSTEQPAN